MVAKIDPFHDIDPLVIENDVDTNIDAACQLEREDIEAFCYRNNVDDNEDEEEWEPAGARNVFDDVFDDFDDEQSL